MSGERQSDKRHLRGQPDPGWVGAVDGILHCVDRSGAMVVTATRRLSRFVQECYAAERLSAGMSVWRVPRVAFWDDWVADCWLDLVLSGREHRTLLSGRQSQLLFEDAIGRSIEGYRDAALLPVPATAKAACEAWTRLHDWRLTVEHLADFSEPDVRVFRQWAQQVESTLVRQRWISGAQLTVALMAALERGEWRVREALLIAGFDEMAPARKALLDALQKNGTQIIHMPLPERPTSAAVVELPDREAEIDAAARWAWHLLSGGEVGPLGIVVPDLAQTRNAVARSLRRTLEPGTLFADSAAAPVFHISFGHRLRDYPLVTCAMLLLSGCRSALSQDQISQILHSPYLGGDPAQRAERALIDQRLRALRRDRIGLADVAYQARSADPGLAVMIENARAQVQSTHRRATPAEWVDWFSRLLAVFQWPGQGVLTSEEEQTRQAWQETLSELGALGAIRPAMDVDQALSQLMDLVSERLFQPRARSAPVQVLGIDEAAGLEFRHLWIVGMSDDVWPPAAAPHPFLPYALQRRHNMPGATATSQLAYAERASRRLLASGEKVIVSYATSAGEQALMLSPLFADLPSLPGDSPGGDFQDPASRLRQSCGALEEFDDRQAPVLQKGEMVSGGTALLRDQSACPFRAFARYRLRAQPVREAELGPDAAERGILAHACLARVWRSLSDSRALEAMSDGQLHAFLDQHIAAELDDQSRAPGDNFAVQLAVLERDRLTELLREWLEFERARPPFTVADTEFSGKLELEGLTLTVKIDRVDDFGDGDRLLIDYKTGTVSNTLGWFGARPDDPQLPAYALACPGVSALALAQVKSGDCRFVGLAEGRSPAPGIPASDGVDVLHQTLTWPEVRHHWEDSLGSLASAFRDGDARVDPKDAHSCDYCDVMPLCRVFDR